MLKDKTATSIEAGSAAITGDQAEACSQLLRDHGAADLIDMLIDPRQIAPDDPDQLPFPEVLPSMHARAWQRSMAGHDKERSR
ncbi:hypothetical protein JMX53_12805 [Cutibacterium avidum]|uniref:hypothetical protein n=1 Tax=Cutibacterium avidum TaxID=33010 RepID=UPI00192AABAF|nr:hypothetical protein [Cutibacterium avidum]QQY15050.1 hypothetical protein JMX53_12805 [Cutibacterium avidum]